MGGTGNKERYVQEQDIRLGVGDSRKYASSKWRWYYHSAPRTRNGDLTGGESSTVEIQPTRGILHFHFLSDTLQRSSAALQASCDPGLPKNIGST